MNATHAATEAAGTRSPRSGKEERIQIRMHSADKQLIKEGAALAGQNVTDFLISSAKEKAMQMIANHNIIMLSKEHFERFAAAVAADAEEPSPEMREAVEDFNAGLQKDGTYRW